MKVNLVELFGEELIAEARKIPKSRFSSRNKELMKVIEPHMDRIEVAMGQKNNLSYMAYAMEYLLNELERSES